MLSRRALSLLPVLLLVAGLAAVVSPAPPAQAAQPVPGHTRLAPDTVRTNTPRITNGEITDLAYIGTRVFVAGTFTSIRNNAGTNTTSYAQPYLASFNLTTGLVDATFRPVFAGGEVIEVEPTPDGTKLIAVGKFNSVNGVTKRKIVALNPTTGATITGFTAQADAVATSVEATNTTVYVGGQFTNINGVARRGLAALNATTGAVITGFQNDLSGGIGVNGAMTVQALVLTPDDSKLLVVNTARQIAGQDRYGIGIISTATNQLLPWRTRLWEDNLAFVGGITRIYAGAIAPNGQYFVVSSGSGGDRPPISDTAVRYNFDGNGTDNEQPVWISRHFDSVYSVAISEVAVYLGGHFNYEEAANSPQPPESWPGLDDVGYGRGQGLAGYGLVPDVVTRDHVSAVDPNTGKALEWNPGSNSFEGNKAMLVMPRGVIAGGDATTQGGQNVGRVAVYDFNSVPAANGNETTITNPLEGQVNTAAQPFTITGTATTATGTTVNRVQVEIIDRGTKQYLQDDLTTWGASNTINATLLGTAGRQRNWQLNVPGMTGNRLLQVLARTYSSNGTNDNTKATKKFETFGLTDQTPSTSITGPFGLVPTTTFTVTGSASDDHGINAINVTFRDVNHRYLQDDGTVDAGYNSFRVTPDVPGALSTTWSYEVTVPTEGQWQGQAIAVDDAGQSDLRSADVTWNVNTTAVTPTVTIAAPRVMIPPTAANTFTLPPNAPVTFSGSATDDKGLNYISVSLSNSTTRQNLASDGSWGADKQAGAYRISGTNSLPGTSANWSYTTPFNLSPGTYSFIVAAVDDEGLSTPSSQYGRLSFTVQVVGDAPPTVTINPTGQQPQYQSLSLPLAGTATDDLGVNAVKVTVKDNDTARFLQPNGTLSASYAQLDATVTPVTPGDPKTVNWSLPVTLPTSGDYSVTSFAIDTVGQTNLVTTNTTARYPVYPGDLAPTVTDNLLAPTEGTVFPEAKIFVSGRLEDDHQIAQGQVAIVNSLGQYMSSQGAFTSTTESWRSAFLNSPGSPGSNFSYTTPAIPAGAYTVRVRGVDQNGLITATPSERHVTVTIPASNVAPVANFPAPTCTNNVCAFDGTSSTDENPLALTYSWNFGNPTGTGTQTSTSAKPTKTYASAGLWTVTLTVKDQYGVSSAPFTRQVQINLPPGNLAPVPKFGPPACSLMACNVSAVGTTDPNVGDVFTYSWNWGDGSAASTTASATHTYTVAGQYTITLTVTDGWGLAAPVLTQQVTVPAP